MCASSSPSSPWSCDAPTEEQWRALARSSPVLWDSVQFVCMFVNGDVGSIRAYASRTQGLTVTRLDGELLAHVPPYRPGTGIMLTTAEGGRPPTTEELASMYPPFAVGSSGLVDTPRSGGPDRSPDETMYDNYQWVAMLDPRELADGRWDPADGPTRDALWERWHEGRDWDDVMADPDLPWALQPLDDVMHSWPGTIVSNLRCVDHHGRRAWEAVVTPSVAYAPRCSCCPLIHSTSVDDTVPFDVTAATAQTGADPLPANVEQAVARGRWAGSTPYPDSRPYLVRLDERTGICVYLQLAAHATPVTTGGLLTKINSRQPLIDLAIEAVDQSPPAHTVPD